MTARFTAIFDHGVLRPTMPVQLENGVEVEVVVISRDAERTPANPASILASLSKLASTSGDAKTSEDHDRILYRSEDDK